MRFAVIGVLTGLILAFLCFVLASDPAETRPRIVGGDAVPNGKHAYVAALLDTTRGNPNNPISQQICGGTLIDPDTVLTAAHCVRGTPPSNFRVTVGRTVQTSNQGVEQPVQRVIQHPQFTFAAADAGFDFAVLNLPNPVPASVARPMPIGSDTLEDGPFIIAGWGALNPNGTGFTDRMQEASVPMRPNAVAARAYGNSWIPSRMIAAGTDDKDSCSGDSGGPLLSRNPAGDLRLVGVTSSGGFPCANANEPGVYVEPNEVLPFIENAS